MSLDGEANDGAAGEGDNLGRDGSIESVTGGYGDDLLNGNDAANRLSTWATTRWPAPAVPTASMAPVATTWRSTSNGDGASP